MPTVEVGVQKYVPTKKWFAALVTGAAAIVASVLVTDGFDDEERGEIAALIAALAGAYFKRNDATLEGKVPASG